MSELKYKVEMKIPPMEVDISGCQIIKTDDGNAIVGDPKVRFIGSDIEFEFKEEQETK